MRLLYRVLFILVLVGCTIAAWILPGAGKDEAGAPPAQEGGAAPREEKKN